MNPLNESSTLSPFDPAVVDNIKQILLQIGVDPQALDGQLIQEMIQAVLRLATDPADTGELKLVARSLKELRYALKVFRPYHGVQKVSIFGSARTRPDHPDYQAAVAFSREMAKAGWMVITGAGDGIMRAGNDGAGREASFGASIRLPFETNANDIISGDTKLVTFRYFFIRKLIFVSQSHAVALFPGGFGTHDEGFEVLTLIQTGKAPIMPIAMVDRPGGHYWKEWDVYVHEHLLASGMISPEDLHLYFVTDDPAEAARHLRAFYRNYHSQRYVGDRLVFRIRHPLTDAQLDQLNSEFSDLIAEGRVEQGPALEQEEAVPDMPRLYFAFTRRDYGRLRQMIDQINTFAPDEA